MGFVMKRMVVIALVWLALFSGITVAEAKDCKPLYVAKGPLTQPGQFDAERSAKAKWRAEIAHKYSSDYADWDKAESKKIECREIAEYFERWAEAIPCR
jgi:hypothetical protein